MQSLLRALALPLFVTATAAQADPPAFRLVSAEADAGRAAHRPFTMPSDRSSQVRPAGLIAAFSVAPNATLGFGRFECPPRRRVSMQDQPVTLDRKSYRRAAVGLSLRF